MNAEQLIDAFLQEKMTPGLKKAFGKMEGKKRCESCGMTIPKYEGRYPKKCPECGGMEFEDLQNQPRYSESVGTPGEVDRRKRRAVIRRIPKDRIPR